MGFPDALRGVKLLFLTDAHIGGNIDPIAREISSHIQLLLEDAHPEKTLIFHGGDFVCSESQEADFLQVSTKLFHKLSLFPQFGVIGNHDQENPYFSHIRRHLEKTHQIVLLENPADIQHVEIEGAILSVHGIHTLSQELHRMSKTDRDLLMDTYIHSIN